MAYDYSSLLHASRHWVEQLIADGYLSPEQCTDLMALDSRDQDPLFAADDQNAPALIVAFFGGTGVGKSSLLNRLAGEAIAKVGIERPTSREVTLYHHHSLTLQQLPSSLPLADIRIRQHHDPQHRQLVWIDMPDIDSIDAHNRQLVRNWLPHIDLLIYVVSPERYRDRKAWQLLQAEGGKHAWLFVINQWDRGQAAQFDDLKQQLSLAGFSDPLLFKTSCLEDSADDFAELVSRLQLISGQCQRLQLQQHQQDLRHQQLRQALQHLSQVLKQRDYDGLRNLSQASWEKSAAILRQGLSWPIQQLAKNLAESITGKPPANLWDDWAQSRLEDCLDDICLQAAQCNMPARPLRSALLSVKTQAGKTVSHYTELSARHAMIKPGNRLQRSALLITAVAETLLPLAAMTVVGYQVFAGYYLSTQQTQAYLGSEFAIHSGLLIGLSWLIPFFLHQKLQPSLESAALNGLHKGLDQALAHIKGNIDQQLEQQLTGHLQYQQQLQQLLAASQSAIVHKITDADLNRLLLNKNQLIDN